MSRSAWLCLFVLVSSLGCGAVDADKKAQEGVATFHQQFNDEKYDAIYDQSASLFRQAMSHDDLVKLLQGIKRKLGTFTKGNVTSTNITASTSGTAVNLVYESEYAQGKATEKFSFAIGDRAFLVGFNINSPVFLNLRGPLSGG